MTGWFTTDRTFINLNGTKDTHYGYALKHFPNIDGAFLAGWCRVLYMGHELLIDNPFRKPKQWMLDELIIAARASNGRFTQIVWTQNENEHILWSV